MDVFYKAIEKNVDVFKYGKKLSKKFVIIVEQYNNGTYSIEIPSCLNKYTIKWLNGSYNNAKNTAKTICSFLNFIKYEIEEEEDDTFFELKDEGVFGLNFYHVTAFLNYCIFTKNVSYDTIKQYEYRLLRFYEFLINMELLKDDVKLEYQYIEESNKRYTISPFKKEPYVVYYPDKKNIKLTKAVNMDEHLWQLFLKVSEECQPMMTLGIAFEMFGGLRRGEVVNLKVEDVIPSRTDDLTKMKLLIKDRSMELFAEKPNVDISKCQVKQERPQIVFNFNNKLYNYYNNHIYLRNKILANTNQKTLALFIDKNGQPMTGRQYEENWKKIKKEFLRLLKNEAYGYYSELTRFTWSTHIGRGIFTNLCLTYNMAKDERELANLRGDRSVNAAQAYIDEFRKRKIINQSLNFITKGVDVHE